MSAYLTEFPPTKAAARQRLQDFVPQAGRAYADKRNTDHGPGRHSAVSRLSPYLRVKLLDEIEVTRAVLAEHSFEAAEKFIQEVFWRSYWKGWLELRPSVWHQTRADLWRLRDQVQTQSGLRRGWEEACLGKTGIAPFDAWAQELVSTGYLHNHARMWFASIWIFTLRLPWELGADFFLRHLLDGDVASNTLGWRWVAGLQTPGKTYLATEENIAKFTRGRFEDVPGLASSAPAVEGHKNPAPGSLPPADEGRPGGDWLLLLHADDVDPGPLLTGPSQPSAWAYLDCTADHSPWEMADHVSAFREGAARDGVPEGEEMAIVTSAEALLELVRSKDLKGIVTPYAPVGTTQDALAAFRKLPDAPPVTEVRRPFDSAAWPKATRGFFKFKENIPDLIDRFVRD